MKAKLIAYSVVHIAPPVYETPYAVGIAEDEGGGRLLVKIKTESYESLRTGVEGDVAKEKGDSGGFNVFSPHE